MLLRSFPFQFRRDDIVVLSGNGTSSTLALACPIFTTAIIYGVPMVPVAAQATGGVPPYTFSALGLPAGLSMSAAGIVSGVPRVVGSAAYSLSVTDANNTEITTSCSLSVQPTNLTTTCLVNGGIVGQALTAMTMIGSGGVAPYTFAAVGLPPGVALSSGGVMTGTPTQAGTFSYLVSLSDSGITSVTISCAMGVSTPQTPLSQQPCRPSVLTLMNIRAYVKPTMC